MDPRVHHRSVLRASLTLLTHSHIHPQASEVVSPFCLSLFAMHSRYPTHPIDAVIRNVIQVIKPPVLPFSPVSCYNGCLFYHVTGHCSVIAYKGCVCRDLK